MRLLLSTVLAILLSLLALPMRAAEPTESDKATARSLMDQGDKATQSGDFQAALEAYRGADDIMKVPTTGIELGKAQLKLGLLLEAQTTFLRVARHPTETGEPSVFADARVEAQQLAAGIPARLPSVLLEFSGVASNVDPHVAIDGTVMPPATLALPRQVNPGEHRLVALAKGFKKIEQTFTATEGKEVTVTLAFEPEARGTTVPEPKDGEPAGSGAQIGGGTWACLGVGLGFAILGAALGGYALKEGKRLQAECDDGVCTGANAEALDRATKTAHAATASLAVGGAVLATFVILLIVDLTSDDADTPTKESAVQPVVGPGWVGVAGRF